MDCLPLLPSFADVEIAARPAETERRAVSRAVHAWRRLARVDGLPAAAALGTVIHRLRPDGAAALDDGDVTRLAALAEVAERTLQPVLYEGWSFAKDGVPAMMRAALLPARATDGTVAVTAVIGHAPFTAALPTAG